MGLGVVFWRLVPGDESFKSLWKVTVSRVFMMCGLTVYILVLVGHVARKKGKTINEVHAGWWI